MNAPLPFMRKTKQPGELPNTEPSGFSQQAAQAQKQGGPPAAPQQASSKGAGYDSFYSSLPSNKPKPAPAPPQQQAPAPPPPQAPAPPPQQAAPAPQPTYTTTQGALSPDPSAPAGSGQPAVYSNPSGTPGQQTQNGPQQPYTSAAVPPSVGPYGMSQSAIQAQQEGYSKVLQRQYGAALDKAVRGVGGASDTMGPEGAAVVAGATAAYGSAEGQTQAELAKQAQQESQFSRGLAMQGEQEATNAFNAYIASLHSNGTYPSPSEMELMRREFFANYQAGGITGAMGGAQSQTSNWYNPVSVF